MVVRKIYETYILHTTQKLDVENEFNQFRNQELLQVRNDGTFA